MGSPASAPLAGIAFVPGDSTGIAIAGGVVPAHAHYGMILKSPARIGVIGKRQGGISPRQTAYMPRL